jgi:ABC-type phosphate transport system substrate-binding protein
MDSISSIAQGQAGIVVIVNNENTIGQLDKSETKFFYLRTIKKNWPGNNIPISPAIYNSENSASQIFMKNVLRMTRPQMLAYFKGKEYAESLPMPPSFGSEEEVINYVSSNKGAIGYVSNDGFLKANGRVKKVFEIIN